MTNYRFRVTFSFYHDLEAKDLEEARLAAQDLARRSKAILVPTMCSEGLGVDAVISWTTLKAMLGREPVLTKAIPPAFQPGATSWPPKAEVAPVACPLCNAQLSMEGRCYNLNCAVCEEEEVPVEKKAKKP